MSAIDLTALESQAFALWKIQVTPEYKRMLMLDIFEHIQNSHNLLSHDVYYALKRRRINLTYTEFMCALASLQHLGVIGLHKTPKNTYHINVVWKYLRAWRKYKRYVMACSNADIQLAGRGEGAQDNYKLEAVT